MDYSLGQTLCIVQPWRVDVCLYQRSLVRIMLHGSSGSCLHRPPQPSGEGGYVLGQSIFAEI